VLFPYPEHGFWGNLIGISLMYLIAFTVYYVIKPLMLKVLENRSESIEPGTDIPFEEYWKEELQDQS
jgi:hypothetical protein